jgi:putative transposase
VRELSWQGYEIVAGTQELYQKHFSEIFTDSQIRGASSGDWQSFLKANNLLGSMSRRGNCHDNAVAESFFQLLKRERIRRKIYSTRQDARADVFDYIEMFYNPKRRHGFNNQLSPVEFEKRHLLSLESV